MQNDAQLRALIEVMPDQQVFQQWCDRRGVQSLAEFVQADLSLVPEPWLTPWGQVQSALQMAHAVSSREGVRTGGVLLGRLFRKPPACVQIPSSLLHLLTPIQVPPSERSSGSLTARQALDQLGGVAGARAVAQLLSEHHLREVTPRQVRDRFRNTGGTVRKLGAGYFATRAFRGAPVLHWVESRLANLGGESKGSLCAAILAAYPHGDERAVQAWLHQQPGVISLRGDRVRLVQEQVLDFSSL